MDLQGKRGHVLVTNIGLSDFRIDATVAGADRSEGPLMANLVNEPSAGRKTKWVRDSLPQKVLCSLRAKVASSI